ncbi:MAG: MmgE/PrpD family protein [Gemmataceae bacterium]|nr:MmgE/PrpD family protein [Gemmataceae bacterium]
MIQGQDPSAMPVSEKMTRRTFAQTAVAGGTAALVGPALPPASAQAPKEADSKFPQVAGLTQQVAAFMARTTYADLPDEVIELGKKSILDSLGLALCGSRSKPGELGRAYIQALGLSRGAATVIGSALKVPARFAAFLHGLAIHSDDYDDTQLAVGADRQYGLLTHPSTTALPAALALAETEGKSGRDLMLAYHIGVEVECKIAEAMSPRHYEHGFHTTGTVGTFGAAAAAAKLRGFDAVQCARVLGIAGSSAAGLRENFGTMTKALHAGRAAEAGVVAAELVASGWTATEQVLESPRGFYHAAAGSYDPKAIVPQLGNPWTFRTPGISIKPFPSGSLAHPAMTELLRLIQEHKIKAQEVERVDVGTNRNIPNALIHHRPKTGLQGKFSMEFCLSCLLLYGRAGLNEFTDAVVNRAEVRNLIERVHLAVHPEAEKAGYNRMTTILDIRLRDGRTISGRADFARGSPQAPMSYAEVAEKFRDCADFAKWPGEKSRAIIEAVRKLEDLADVRMLTALCTA